MTPNDSGGNYGDWREERRRRWEERRQRKMERMRRMTEGGVFIHGDSGSGRLFLGTIVLLLGILFLLQNLGIFYVDRLWRLWPVILIGVGIGRMIDGRDLHRKTWGATLVAIGAVFLAINLGYLPPRVWTFLWPAALIFWGIVLLVRGFDRDTSWTSSSIQPDVSSGSEDTLHALAIFGGINRRVQSQNFRGGEAVAIFGGIELDLRGASTTLDELDIEANAVFGGIEMIVPDTWDVVVRGTGILGGYEDKTHRVPTVEGVKRPRLIIRGGAVFGGVTVK